MSEVARFADLATTILAAPPRCGRVRLVAIDGPGGAGKSVFAARLAKALGGVPVVETDDFASWENPHDWWDRLEADVLESLERGQLVRYQAYDLGAEEDAFFERDGTRDRADLIVDGSPSEPHDPDLEFITA
jgi:adenylate kinase family enzyme